MSEYSTDRQDKLDALVKKLFNQLSLEDACLIEFLVVDAVEQGVFIREHTGKSQAQIGAEAQRQVHNLFRETFYPNLGEARKPVKKHKGVDQDYDYYK